MGRAGELYCQTGSVLLMNLIIAGEHTRRVLSQIQNISVPVPVPVHLPNKQKPVLCHWDPELERGWFGWGIGRTNSTISRVGKPGDPL